MQAHLHMSGMPLPSHQPCLPPGPAFHRQQPSLIARARVMSGRTWSLSPGGLPPCWCGQLSARAATIGQWGAYRVPGLPGDKLADVERVCTPEQRAHQPFWGHALQCGRLACRACRPLAGQDRRPGCQLKHDAAIIYKAWHGTHRLFCRLHRKSRTECAHTHAPAG